MRSSGLAILPRVRPAFALVFLLIATSTARADEPYQWNVVVDPLTVALGFVHVQVERALHPRVSVYAGPNMRLFTSPILGAEEDDEVRGFGLEVGVRVFFYGDAPEGAWILVRGVLAALRDGERAGPGGYGSALVGYTFVHRRLVLGGGLGIQYLAYSLIGKGPSGFAPAAHTAIGVAF